MINSEPDFVNITTLSRMYDSTQKAILATLHNLLERGHQIDRLSWGKQGKLKVNPRQFRIAVLAEYKKGEEKCSL